MSTRLPRQRRGIAALTAMTLFMGGLAVWHQGMPATKLELNDGGVWVTNQAARLVGHLNYPSRTLDGAVRAGSGQFDINQHANTVVLSDADQGRAQNINTANLTLGDGTTVAGDLALVQGGEWAAAADSKAGRVWTMRADAVDLFRTDSDPVLDKSPGVRVAVGVDGIVHLITPDGGVQKIVDGKPVPNGRVEGLKELGTASLTVVGDQLVVLDKAGAAIRTTRGSVAVDNAATLALQLPGPASDRVLVAGPDSYLWAPLAGGEATRAPSGAGLGAPAAPAVLQGCGYLAWAGSGAYVRDCVADADDRRQVVPKLATFGEVAFRLNRDVIVLNDVETGTLLLVNDDMRVIDNWRVVDSAQKEETETETTPETTDEVTQADKKQKNTRPVPKNDDFGVRPGGSFALPVIYNDADADGDLLTASVKTQPEGASVVPVRGGEALNITVPQDAKGPYSFTYTVDDGRGGTADASVYVRVHPDSVEEAPEQKRAPTLTVARRGQASYSLLGDFQDPEGDPLYLTGVDQPTGLSVKWRPDGVVTVKDLGTASTGMKEIHVEVSDGRKGGTGVLRVNVRQGELAAIANNDHVTVLKNQSIIVRPLANDVDPEGGQLRLTNVQAAGPGQTIKPDYASGTFQLSATTPGTFYPVSYTHLTLPTNREV